MPDAAPSPVWPALAGGVLGLAAAYGLAWFGLWPTVPAEAPPADPRVAQMAAEIPELRTVTETTQSELAALNQRNQRAGDRRRPCRRPAASPLELGTVEADIAALTARIDGLDAAPATNVSSEEINALRQSLAGLEARLERIGGPGRHRRGQRCNARDQRGGNQRGAGGAAFRYRRRAAIAADSVRLRGRFQQRTALRDRTFGLARRRARCCGAHRDRQWGGHGVDPGRCDRGPLCPGAAGDAGRASRQSRCRLAGWGAGLVPLGDRAAPHRGNRWRRSRSDGVAAGSGDRAAGFRRGRNAVHRPAGADAGGGRGDSGGGCRPGRGSAVPRWVAPTGA